MRRLSASRHKAKSSSPSLTFKESEVFRELIEEIEKRALPVSLPPNRVLFRESDPPENLYLVKTGRVAFTVQGQVRTIPFFTVGSGSLIGLSAIIAQRPVALTATASPRAEIVKIDADAFLDLIESRSEWYMCALRSLAEEAVEARDALARALASEE